MGFKLGLVPKEPGSLGQAALTQPQHAKVFFC